MTSSALDDICTLLNERVISGNEYSVLYFICQQQLALAPVYRADMAAQMGVSVATVGRLLKSLRDKGLLIIERLGTKLWSYCIKIGSKIVSTHICTLKNESTQKKTDLSSVLSSSSNSSSLSSSSYINDLTSNTFASTQNCASTHAGGGPLKYSEMTPLVSTLQDVVSRPTKPPKERKPYPFTKKDRTARLRERMAGKDLDHYNCTDLRFVFEDEWNAKKWNGVIPRWKGKELGLARELIDEFGAADTVRYFQYVFRNWDSIARRFKAKGYPTLGLLSAYSCHLYPEMLNGVRCPNFNDCIDRSMLVGRPDDSQPSSGESASLAVQVAEQGKGSHVVEKAPQTVAEGAPESAPTVELPLESEPVDYCAKFSDEEWAELQDRFGFMPSLNELKYRYRMKKQNAGVDNKYALPDVCLDTSARQDAAAYYRDKFDDEEWEAINMKAFYKPTQHDYEEMLRNREGYSRVSYRNILAQIKLRYERWLESDAPKQKRSASSES